MRKSATKFARGYFAMIPATAAILAGMSAAPFALAGAQQQSDPPQQQSTPPQPTNKHIVGKTDVTVQMPPTARYKPPAIEVPDNPPPFLYFQIEEVAPGQTSAHLDNLAAQLAVYRHAGWPLHSIALDSIAGPGNEFVILVGFETFHAMDQTNVDFADSPKDLTRYQQLTNEEDAMLESHRGLVGVYRPDLSYQVDHNAMAHARVVFMNEQIVRAGQSDEYESDMKFVVQAFSDAHTKINEYVYQIVAGAPPGTYIRIEPLRGLGDWDDWPNQMKNTMESLDDAGRKRFLELGKDYTVETPAAAHALGDSPATRLYNIHPELSSVTDSFAAKDPAFWRPNKPQ